MKRILASLVLLGLMLFVVGCSQVMLGVQPVPPSSNISAESLWSAINSLIDNKTKALIYLEWKQYESVPMAMVQNATSQVVMDPRWGTLTACEALIVEIRRASPRAAAGIILIGPSGRASHRVIVADKAIDGTIMIGLVDPLAKEDERIKDWTHCESVGFVVI